MKIAIIEDHLLMRDILRRACGTDLGHRVVAEAGTGAEAIEAVARSHPELLLLDLQLPDLDGLEVLKSIRGQGGKCRVLILSSHCNDYTVYRVERAGVDGFVDKNSNALPALREALAVVAEGGRYFSEPYLRLKASRRRDPRAFDKLLTDREQTVLILVGSLLTDAEIARRLGLSALTVAKHRFNILGKLGLSSTAGLARYARDHGFTPPSGPLFPA